MAAWAVAATFDDVQLIANQHNAGFAAANNQARAMRGSFSAPQQRR
jgi:GT2 family glycosyltransferase